MISNLSLGSAGRLGNQMFQYAMLLGIKCKLGYQIMLDEAVNEKSIYGSFELTNCFSLKECAFYHINGINVPIKYNEEYYHFDKRFFKKITDNTNFTGHFQSEKYFSDCASIVRKEFTFKEHIQNEARSFLKPYQNKRLVSIHVRRGDYNGLPNHHPVCTLEYYKEAMTHFADDVQYICFSDDIAWCKENLPIANIIFSDNSTAVDLCIMSMCHDNIIANSSYSWWGAWLNTTHDKKVIAPKIWFGPFYSHYDTSDLYCKDWIIL